MPSAGADGEAGGRQLLHFAQLETGGGGAPPRVRRAARGVPPDDAARPQIDIAS